ncbi:hypothetical protein D3C76_1822940 [compost metagenome]
MVLAPPLKAAASASYVPGVVTLLPYTSSSDIWAAGQPVLAVKLILIYLTVAAVKLIVTVLPPAAGLNT